MFSACVCARCKSWCFKIKTANFTYKKEWSTGKVHHDASGRLQDRQPVPAGPRQMAPRDFPWDIAVTALPMHRQILKKYYNLYKCLCTKDNCGPVPPASRWEAGTLVVTTQQISKNIDPLQTRTPVTSPTRDCADHFDSSTCTCKEKVSY